MKRFLTSAIVSLSLGFGFLTAIPAFAHQTVTNGMTTAQVKAKTIVETAVAAPELANLVRLLQSAKLVNALSAKGPFTVFAPTNLATSYLAKDPEDPNSVRMLIEDLEKNPKLGSILKYHVVSGNYSTNGLSKEHTLKTLNGQSLKFVKQSNGKIQIQTSGGTKLATITKSITTKNGTVHIIDRVLLKTTKAATPTTPVTPTPDPTPIPVTPPAPPVMPEGLERLSTLLGVVGNLGLDGVLNAGNKTYTVIGPNNQAFANLSFDPNDPARVKSDLDKIFNNTPYITRVIKNHVFEGTVRSTDLKDGQILTNILGDQVQVSLKNGKVYFTDLTSHSVAEVRTADINVPFGVIHEVVEVLLP